MNADLSTPATRELPPELESPRAKLVYLYLLEGPASVDDLKTDLGLAKITLYGVLRTLRERGVVERCDGRYAAAE